MPETAVSPDIIDCESIAETFVERVTRSANEPAFWHIQDVSQSLQPVTWMQMAADVLQRNQAFESRQIGLGTKVAHLSENRYDWLITDLALQFLGAVHVPLHALVTEQQANEQLQASQSTAIIVSNSSQAEKVAAFCRSSQPWLPLFCYDDQASVSRITGQTALPVAPLAQPDVQELEPTRLLQSLKQRLVQNDVGRARLLTILFTSGTAGPSKGVMLTQGNVTANVASKLTVLPLTGQDIRLCMLPLTHIFARTCDFYTWIASGSQLSISHGRESWFQELQLIRPTYINSVPYFYEKCVRFLGEREQLDQPGALARLLGGRVRIANCGGAPIADEIFDTYHQHDVCLITGYGLTETSPVLSSSSPTKLRRGAVGPAVPGVELKIADDGEILARGDCVMPGYYRNSKATRETLRDGWLHTGDLGRIDEAGFLFIVGRKKEMIVTSGGKNISPINLESLLNHIPSVRQSFVFGDRMDFLAAILVVDPAALALGVDRFAEMDIHQDPLPGRLYDFFRAELDRALATVSKHEQIKSFFLTDQAFSIENGMLTAKASLRRDQIMQSYAERIGRIAGTSKC